VLYVAPISFILSPQCDSRVKLKEMSNDAPDAVNDSQETKKLFLFEIDGELYAVDVDCVDRVMKIPPITPIPNVPRAIIGIFHLRGKVILALDLASRMDIPKVKPLSQNYLFVLHYHKEQFAVLIDRPKIITEVLMKNISQPDPIIAAHVPPQYIEGVFTFAETVVHRTKSRSIIIEPVVTHSTPAVTSETIERPVLWLNIEKLFDQDDLKRVFASQE
jgi:purine-binding chemotaxis protein CheW